MNDVRVFESERRRLFGIAYGMLGQVMDAEDIVQDAFLRWQGTDVDHVDNPAAYLTTITTRLAIDRLRSASVRREQYVGPWLPEPIVPGITLAEDPGDIVAEAEQISLALLTAFERLNPVERAVLLLRDVFDFDYGEIADVVERSAENCRQIASRARDRVGDAGRSYPVTAERQQELMNAFVLAMSTGDVEFLRGAFAADVTLWSDGGGKARAARHPIHGAAKVAQFLIGIRKWADPEDRYAFTTANGYPAVYIARAGVPLGIVTLQMSEDGIIGVRNIVNPDKMGHLEPVEAPIIPNLTME